ncbi:putative transposase [Chryseobacterium defluvii]|uniref:Putative transposase n=1 Tax=Chryseobacterium defluvii TaxID=160396 RepID=A0A840KJC3_9FLAO|nr:putative transposase [Chryseobacterium defluvii]
MSTNGISQATFFNWKKKYGDLGLSKLRKLRQLEEENAQLKKLVAYLSLDKQMLQEVIKKAITATQKKEMSLWLIESYQISVQHAWRCALLARSVFYYKSHSREDHLLRMRINEIAKTRVRYGFKRIYILLKREGFTDNHKRVYRVYKEEGLDLRSKSPRRNRAGAHRLERLENSKIDKVWSMDFIQDYLYNRNRFRVLTVVDNFSKKCLGLMTGKSLKGTDVAIELEKICILEKCRLERIQCNNGSEFISKEVDKWVYENRVVLDFSRPGKPTDNLYVESFNGKFRDECLSVNRFLSLEDAEKKIEDWKWDYNLFRPHSSLNDNPRNLLTCRRKNSSKLYLKMFI